MAESDAGKAGTSFARTPSRNRTIALWAAALVTIALGFADLARGGTTIAPLLLVLGYCVLVPIAILK
ncbi:MAG TPA: hypothetical protein VFC35_07125 [Gemmatimonadaceae bacterium]|nr:hypothetical protein [Gemmatimonadaceae bacterium]